MHVHEHLNSFVSFPIGGKEIVHSRQLVFTHDEVMPSEDRLLFIKL